MTNLQSQLSKPATAKGVTMSEAKEHYTMTANKIKSTSLYAAIKAVGFDAVFLAYTYGPSGESSDRQSHLSRAWHAGMLGHTAVGLGVVGPKGKLPS